MSLADNIIGPSSQSFIDAGSGLMRPMQDRGRSLARNVRLKPDNIISQSAVDNQTPMMLTETAPLSPAESTRMAEVNAELGSESMALSPTEQFGLGVVSEGLKLAGNLQDIKANEREVMQDLQNKYQLATDQIDFNSQMAENVREMANIRLITTELSQLLKASQGPVQRQIFTSGV